MSDRRKSGPSDVANIDYSTSEEEIIATIDEVARRRLGISGEEAATTCRSGNWSADRNNYELWSWLNNLVTAASCLNGDT